MLRLSYLSYFLLIAKPLQLTPAFRSIPDELENSSDSFFITGRAGTGKSTLLELFIKTTKRNVVVLAPTGIAALNVKGQTIHSFFNLPPKLVQPSELHFMKYKTKLMKAIEIIIIDEISMVRADILDHIDYLMRRYKNSPLPFGGARLVAFGDLFQLPPVVSTPVERQYFSEVYETPYFFSALVFKQAGLKMIELRDIFRQTDQSFINLLEVIRYNQLEYEDLEFLNTRCVPLTEEDDTFITLSSTNAIADTMNQKKLAEIAYPAITFKAELSGQFAPHYNPVDPLITLKQGAQVMFVRNDPDQRYVNGTIGIISKLTESVVEVEVETPTGKTIVQADKATWDMIQYKPDPKNPDKISSESIGSYTQIPLKLAWAVTIHKSQGKTFDKVMIDLGRGAFEFGQTYVALSRCKTLEGIILKRPVSHRDIMVDERVVEFYLQNR